MLIKNKENNVFAKYKYNKTFFYIITKIFFKIIITQI